MAPLFNDDSSFSDDDNSSCTVDFATTTTKNVPQDTNASINTATSISDRKISSDDILKKRSFKVPMKDESQQKDSRRTTEVHPCVFFDDMVLDLYGEDIDSHLDFDEEDDLDALLDMSRRIENSSQETSDLLRELLQ